VALQPRRFPALINDDEKLLEIKLLRGVGGA
jgi:hypothetical protein